MRQSVLPKRFIGENVIDSLSDLAPVGVVLGVVVMFFLFNEEILHDYRLLVATFLLVVGISLLSWLRPEENEEQELN